MILMEFLNHVPLKGEKFHFIGWVVGLYFGLTLAGVGNYSISSIIMSLV